MQPTKIDNRQEDIFRGRLSSELNPKHEMMILARMISWDSLESEFSDLYQSNGSAGGQPPKLIRLDKNKFYSLHEPDLDCISKSKARKSYEFGCKVSIEKTHKQGLVTSSEALPENPYDGHTLKPSLESSERARRKSNFQKNLN